MDPRVALASAYLGLSIPFGPNSPPPTLDFGVHPRIYTEQGVDLPGPSAARIAGQASPLGYWYTGEADPSVHREELAHIDQMEALGPAFYLAYALTGGEPFEPYRMRQGDYDIDFNRMWTPEDDQRRQFPQFRATLGDDPSLEFMPGYGDLLEALLGLIQ